MYSLVRGLYEKYFSKPTFKILLVGLAGSGKTVGSFVDGGGDAPPPVILADMIGC